MKLKFCIVALFLHNTQQTKLNQRQRIRNQFYAQANDEAAALNAYKDYNLDKSDYKQLAQKSGPDNDKKAFKLAEEMDEDEESQAPKNEQDDLLDADNVKQDEPKPKQKQSLLESVANNNPYGDSKPEKNEEEVEEQLQVSENALNLSQGEKQMRVDLTPS
jgi:saccharopepsin